MEAEDGATVEEVEAGEGSEQGVDAGKGASGVRGADSGVQVVWGWSARLALS